MDSVVDKDLRPEVPQFQSLYRIRRRNGRRGKAVIDADIKVSLKIEFQVGLSSKNPTLTTSQKCILTFFFSDHLLKSS